MVLEVAILHVKPGMISDFESNFRKASRILHGVNGHIEHELHKCVQVKDKYILLVKWHHINVGFRQSDEYKQWKALLHPFYETTPVIEHYINIRLD